VMEKRLSGVELIEDLRRSRSKWYFPDEVLSVELVSLLLGVKFFLDLREEES